MQIYAVHSQRYFGHMVRNLDKIAIPKVVHNSLNCKNDKCVGRKLTGNAESNSKNESVILESWFLFFSPSKRDEQTDHILSKTNCAVKLFAYLKGATIIFTCQILFNFIF